MDLDALYRRYAPMVYRRCRQLLQNDSAALDAMQDVFVKCLRYRSRLSSEAPSALLNRIATNVCLNRLRGRQMGELSEAMQVIASAPDTEEHSLASMVLARLFRNEPASTRTMAVLHYVDGMTLEEVAHEVSLSVSGVRKRLRIFQQRLTSPEVP